MTAQTQDKNKVPQSSKAPQGDDGRGTTAIADNVVAKIAGIAVRDIPGVHALGGGAARALGSLRDAVGQKDHTQGINVEVGQTQVAVDITLVVEYPHPLKEVAAQVRDAIYSAVEDLVGMEVTEVNVTVTDIHVPGDDATGSNANSDDANGDSSASTTVGTTRATTEPRVS